MSRAINRRYLMRGLTRICGTLNDEDLRDFLHSDVVEMLCLVGRRCEEKDAEKDPPPLPKAKPVEGTTIERVG